MFFATTRWFLSFVFWQGFFWGVCGCGKMQHVSHASVGDLLERELPKLLVTGLLPFLEIRFNAADMLIRQVL